MSFCSMTTTHLRTFPGMKVDRAFGLSTARRRLKPCSHKVSEYQTVHLSIFPEDIMANFCDFIFLNALKRGERGEDMKSCIRLQDLAHFISSQFCKSHYSCQYTLVSSSPSSFAVPLLTWCIVQIWSTLQFYKKRRLESSSKLRGRESSPYLATRVVTTGKVPFYTSLCIGFLGLVKTKTER